LTFPKDGCQSNWANHLDFPFQPKRSKAPFAWNRKTALDRLSYFIPSKEAADQAISAISSPIFFPASRSLEHFRLPKSSFPNAWLL